MKKSNILYLSSLSLLLSGCAAPIVVGAGVVGFNAVEDRGLGGIACDQTLRTKLNYEFGEELADYSGIELTVYKSQVLLTGVAASEAIKEKAVQITKAYPGVKRVIDGMNVSGEDGLAEYTRDAWLTTKLKASLMTEQDIYLPNYVFRAFDKTIYIFGTAGSAAEKELVLEHATDIKGVKKVVDLIEVCKTP